MGDRDEAFDDPCVHRFRAIEANRAVGSRTPRAVFVAPGEETDANEANGRLAYRFHARDVNLILAPPADGAPARFRVSLDGEPPNDAAGLDVDSTGNGTVCHPRLYQLIRQTSPIDDRVFEIEFLGPGVQAYAFTFG